MGIKLAFSFIDVFALLVAARPRLSRAPASQEWQGSYSRLPMCTSLTMLNRS